MSVATKSTNPDSNEMQSVADKISEWAITNRMILNADKTKEMVIYFGRRYVKDEIKSTCIQTVAIERIDTFKLLGVIFSSDLTWENMSVI